MPLKHFRKFKIVAADVDRVVKHLKLHKSIGANDIILRPLAKPRKRGKQVLHDEPIPWVLPKALMGSWQQKDLANARRQAAAVRPRGRRVEADRPGRGRGGLHA